MPAVSPLPVSGENAKCHDDTRPSARAGIGAAVMQNGCRVLKDSKSFRQPLLVTELTGFALFFAPFLAAFLGAGFFTAVTLFPLALAVLEAPLAGFRGGALAFFAAVDGFVDFGCVFC
jgi:hypothetical protein